MKPKKGLFRKVLWRLGLVRRSEFLAGVEKLKDQLKAQQKVGRHLSRSLTAVRGECDEVFAPLVEKAMKMNIKRKPEEDMSLEVEVDKQFIVKAMGAGNQPAAVEHLCRYAGGRMTGMLMKYLVETINKKR